MYLSFSIFSVCDLWAILQPPLVSCRGRKLTDLRLKRVKGLAIIRDHTHGQTETHKWMIMRLCFATLSIYKVVFSRFGF